MNPITQSQIASRVNAISPTPHGAWSEKRIAFLVLALALAAQIAWMLFNHFGRQAPWLSMSWSLEFALPFLLLLLTGGRICWIASLLRLPISMASCYPSAIAWDCLARPAAREWRGGFRSFHCVHRASELVCTSFDNLDAGRAGHNRRERMCDCAAARLPYPLVRPRLGWVVVSVCNCDDHLRPVAVLLRCLCHVCRRLGRFDRGPILHQR